MERVSKGYGWHVAGWGMNHSLLDSNTLAAVGTSD
jgi:hypothetical protein